ncbi:sensor histidine kinase [Roseateles sp. NT4]|uniref:sensor histidine kinase n=1 Tax=Roseateles sp. NT4 TaxID=3453715 RepID=UPI003EE9B19B
MPPPSPHHALLSPAALAVAAGACLVLAGGLLMPDLVNCKFAGEDQVCAATPLHGVRSWLAVSFMLYMLWLAAALSQPWLPRAPRQRRWGLGVQIVALTVLSTFVGLVVHHRFGGPDINFAPYSLQIQATITACVCLALDYHQRGRRQQADAESLRLDEQEQARQLDAARAALLQAQVEPHFLFNTLAHLRRLAHTDARAARAMLAELRLYLAAALPELRQAETSLAREIELVTAFLALHQRRIGPERLTLRYEVAPGLGDVVVPSTCLLTLAENAIKHGIGPQVEGGEICVRALPDPDEPDLLRLEVADTGAGMGSSSGSGTGLATLRARLASAYGSAARLSLHLNQPRGLIARVQMPWR